MSLKDDYNEIKRVADGVIRYYSGVKDKYHERRDAILKEIEKYTLALQNLDFDHSIADERIAAMHAKVALVEAQMRASSAPAPASHRAPQTAFSRLIRIKSQIAHLELQIVPVKERLL